MESELSGIFQVKLVTKNIARGSPGTQFMHMRVNICFNGRFLVQLKKYLGFINLSLKSYY